MRRGKATGGRMTLYSLGLGVAAVISAPWWLWHMTVGSRYREGLWERLGHVPRRVRDAVRGRQVAWVHAVSVGEVMAVTPLVQALEAALEGAGAESGRAPWRVVVSTTTRTGQRLARERFGAERVFWFPLDFRWAVRAWMRALGTLRLVVLVESELWPRLLAECAREDIPVAVVNARISDRSFRRARLGGRVWTRVLRDVSLFLAQSEETAGRLRSLGALEARVQVLGNLKYDVAPRPSAIADALRPLLARSCPVVAGSLLRGEEELLLQRWPRICAAAPHAVLLLAPRHPERFAEVARLVGERFALVRASALVGKEVPAEAPVAAKTEPIVLLDTVGDLQAVYELADVAFVGGSLVRKGGHNPLEPARFGVPVLMGPSFENFREIVGTMEAGGGIRIVRDGDELASELARLLRDRVAADAMGQRGMQVFERERGATGRSMSALMGLLGEAGRR